MRVTTLIVAGTLWTVGLSAQEETAPPARRWSIAGTIGAVRGGPTPSVLNDLAALGWGATDPGGCFFIFCSEPTEYPQADAGHSGELTVRYSLTNRWAVSTGTTWNLHLGTARGHREGPPDFWGLPTGDHLDGHFQGKSTWVAGHIEAAGRLSAGGGVVLHSINNRDGDPFSTPSSHRRLGLMGEAGIRLPRATRVFWQLTFRGHWIPGSVEFQEQSSASGSSVPLEVGLSYATITTGIGIRM